MSPADDLSEISPPPELEFLESTEDALSAFLPEETAGKHLEAGNRSRRADYSNDVATLRPHLRGQRLPVRPGVLIALCGSLAVVLILVVGTRSRWWTGGYLALIPTPSVVAALPEPPDPTPPTSARQGPGSFKDDAIPQQKGVVQSSQRGLLKRSPDPPPQRSTSRTREATRNQRNLTIPSTPVVSQPDHVDTGSEAVRAASAEARAPSALSTYAAGSDSPSAVVPPIAPPSPVSASVTTVPPPNAVAASTAANPAIGEELAVRNILSRYRGAYGSLNVNAAKGVWPSVNTRALSRAFDGLQSQEVDFSECQIRLDNNRATVTCGGTARFVPKVGNRSERVESREWEFEMHKADDQWTIAKVQVR